jgi:hypothetical protein
MNNKTTIETDSCNVNELNAFFSRFDSLSSQDQPSLPSTIPSCTRLRITDDEVTNALRQLDVRKPPGPDGLLPRVLKLAAVPLTPVVKQIFENSLHQRRVPSLWTIAKIKPIPKGTNTPKHPTEFRPIAITSTLVKILERIILQHLTTTLEPDNSQFAYKSNRGVGDAILCVTDLLMGHIDKKAGNYCRRLFIDFSSAFNTLVPNKLMECLDSLHADQDVMGWIASFLCPRRQYVTYNNETSSTITTLIGTPQGSVISPYLFTTYIASLKSDYQNVKMFKYADDIIIVGLFEASRPQEEEHYFEVITDTVAECDRLELKVNTSKTKEMVVSRGASRTNNDNITPVVINDQPIETVTEYRYLGTTITSNLDFNVNYQEKAKKARKRLFLLRKLKYANASPSIIRMTYTSFIRSVISCHLEFFYELLSKATIKEIKAIERSCNRILSFKERLPEIVSDQARQQVIYKLFLNKDHPFTMTLDILPSGRLRLPKSEQAWVKSLLEQFLSTLSTPRSIKDS